MNVDVTLGPFSAALDSEGYAPLLNESGEGRGDVAWHGDDLVVMNGAVEQYVGTITDELVVTVDGEELVRQDVTIHDACGHVVQLRPYQYEIRPDHQAFVELYLGQGPDLDQVPVERLEDFDSFGPDPDPNDAGATGSSRMAWHRSRMALAMLLLDQLGDGPTRAQLDEIFRWSRDQWERSYHYYRRDEGYAPWIAHEDPDAIVGKGYRAAGGFWTTYSSTELHGRPKGVTNPGKNPPDEQHLAVEQLLFGYLLTGGRAWASGRSAWHLLEKHAGSLMKASWSSIRAHGWSARGLAQGVAVLRPVIGADVDHLWEVYLPVLLQKLEGKNGDVPGRLWSVRDTGYSCDHICISDAIRGAFALQGITDEETIRDLATKAQSSWMTSILILGIDWILKAVYRPGTPEHRAWRAQLDRAAHFLVQTCTAPGYDWQTLALVETDYVWDDVAPKLGPVVKAGSSKKGTPASVTIAALEVLLADYIADVPEDKRAAWEAPATRAADAIVDDLNASRYWNGKDPVKWMLDSGWSTGHRRGWQPDG